MLQDLLRFNRFFIDKEEDSVIKLQSLADRIAAASSAEQLQALKAELVDFHGAACWLLLMLVADAAQTVSNAALMFSSAAHSLGGGVR